MGTRSDLVEQLRIRRAQRVDRPRTRLTSRPADDLCVDDDEHELRLGRDLPIEEGPPRAASGTSRESSHLAFEDQLVARDDLTAESSPVETAEQRQLSGEPVISEHRERSDLRDRFTHEHTRQCRAPGEVTLEEPLVTRQFPTTARRHAGDQIDDLVDEEERWAMRKQIGRLHEHSL